MQSIRFTLFPSGEGSVFLSPLGLSEDDISHKNLKASKTRVENRLRREYSTPQPSGPSCERCDRRSFMPNELSRDAKRKVVESCSLIQDVYGRENVCFFTGTFPTRDEAHLAHFNSVWQKAMRRWTRKLRYHLEKGGVHNFWVYKVEFHQDSWPHVHAVYPARRPGTKKWIIGKQQAQHLWASSWVEEGLTPPSTDWSLSTRVEAVRKSAGGYMAKYLSKEASTQVLEHPTSVTRFWGSSRPMKELLRRSTYKGSSSGSYPELLDYLERLREEVGVLESSPLMALESGGMWQGFSLSKKSLNSAVGVWEEFCQKPSAQEKLDANTLRGNPSMHGVKRAKKSSGGGKSS